MRSPATGIVPSSTMQSASHQFTTEQVKAPAHLIAAGQDGGKTSTFILATLKQQCNSQSPRQSHLMLFLHIDRAVKQCTGANVDPW
jgi:hypothetical protein